MQYPLRNAPISEDGNSKVFSQFWSGWFRVLYNILSPGISANVTLAKLTTGGANGSLTVKNGIITSYTAPT